MKKPNSRRWRQQVKREQGWGALVRLDRGDLAMPDGLQHVGINFICKRGHDAVIVGQFGRNTFEGADDHVWWVKLANGESPEEAGRPEGQAKGLLICDRCGHEKQIRLERIVAALDAIYAPGLRRVVDYPI